MSNRLNYYGNILIFPSLSHAVSKLGTLFFLFASGHSILHHQKCFLASNNLPSPPQVVDASQSILCPFCHCRFPCSLKISATSSLLSVYIYPLKVLINILCELHFLIHPKIFFVFHLYSFTIPFYIFHRVCRASNYYIGVFEYHAE